MGKRMILMCLFLVFSLQAQSETNGFLSDYQPKEAVIPEFVIMDKPAGPATVIVTASASDTLGRVSPYIYGNNGNLYMTQMVDQPDLLDEIRILSPNIIRFPGGNLSSIFLWDALPNQPPAFAPDVLLDGDGNEYTSGYWWGKNTSGWTLSVDNYYEMLERTDNTGMITVNYPLARYGTGVDPVADAAGYAADWVRYDDGRTRFWEIGNESSGPWQAGFRIDTAKNQDGQPEVISGEIYGKHFKVFADSMRKAAEEIGHTIYIGAQLIQYDARNSWNPPDRDWNSGYFAQAGDAADFYIIHSYYTNYNENSTAAVILNSATTETRNMMDYMHKTTSENGVSMKPIALTEWNIFAVGSKQSCSYINGMHAAIVLGELAVNGYGNACRWDLANGYDNGNDHGMFNNRDEPGVPDWNPRPVFFYMTYFQKFFGDHVLQCEVTGSDNVLAYVSTFSSGETGVVIVNKGKDDEVAGLALNNIGVGETYYIYSLTGGDDNGEFSQVVYVNGTGPTCQTGGPIDEIDEIKAFGYSIENEILVSCPARTVQYVLIESGDIELAVADQKKRDSVNDEAGIQIYPSPAHGHFSVQFNPGLYHTVDIVNVRGRTVYSRQISPAVSELNLKPDLATGTYLVRMRGAGKVRNHPFIFIK